MKHLIIPILIFSSNFCYAQKDEYYIKSDTVFEAFRGKIAGQYIYMFLQNINDSTIQGHYHYLKYGENISLIGRKTSDSIYLFEVDKNGCKTALITGRFVNDSINGIWSDIKGNRKFTVNIYKSNTTGDVYVINNKNNSLVFKHENDNYILPFSKYLDNKYNYTFCVLFSGLINSNFCSIVTFINYPTLQRIRKNSGDVPSEQFLFYTKYRKDGSIDTVQIVKVKSENEGIKTVISSDIYYPFKDSLDIDIFHLFDNYKLDVTFNKVNDKNGMIIKKEQVNYPIYLHDTLKLEIDNVYDLVRRYKIKDVDNELNYSYQIDTVYEKNNKDLHKLSLFCEAFKGQIVNSHNIVPRANNENISYEDYNFDGISDIFINTTYPGAPVNDISQEVWLYNSQTDKFERNEVLSNMPIWGIDRKNKTIETGNRSGAAHYYVAWYKFINGNFIVVETENSTIDKKGNQIVLHKKLVNNKWIETKGQQY